MARDRRFTPARLLLVAAELSEDLVWYPKHKTAWAKKALDGHSPVDITRCVGRVRRIVRPRTELRVRPLDLSVF